jgi:hypothetical protein
MKRLRMLSLILLICAAVSFGYCKVRQMQENDYMPPVINTENKTIEVSIHDEESSLLEGVTATDLKDGDVTDSIVIENISDFLTDGRRIVTYAAFDSDNNVSKTDSYLVYSDYTKPHFSLSEPLRFPMATTSYLENVTATDCLDGDITSKIKYSSGYEIYSGVAGDYSMQLEVTNSAGDTAYLPVTFTIYDSTAYNRTPQILLKDYLVYTKTGEAVEPASYLEEVDIMGVQYGITDGAQVTDTTIGRDAISIDDGGIDYQTPGVYEIVYSYTYGEQDTGTVRLIVVVED